MRRNLLVITAAVVALSAQAALAQPSNRAVVAFAAGVSTGEHQTGGAFGGTLVVNLDDWVAVEGTGTYFDRGSGADAFNVGGSLIVNLAVARSRGVPYVAVGGGVHHAVFDLSDERFFGNRPVPFPPGSRVCAAPGTGAGAGHMPGWGVGSATCPANLAGYVGVGEMPRFYGQRLGVLEVPAGGGWNTRSFTDPAIHFGGGVRINLTERLTVRPDLRALMVFGNGDTHTIGVFVVNMGYRF
jgi:hypothetical protein